MASDNSGLIKLGIAGAAAYYAYSQGWLSFLGIGTAAAPAAAGVPPVAVGGSVAAPGAAVAPPPPVTAPAGPSLSSLYTQLVAAAGAAHQPGDNPGPDEYNALLTSIYPAAGPLPDPVQLFAGTGWSRPGGMPIAAYWSLTSTWLQANKGLSGLNAYAGLGAIAVRQRGWGF
jgi:hypothetical protein